MYICNVIHSIVLHKSITTGGTQIQKNWNNVNPILSQFFHVFFSQVTISYHDVCQPDGTTRELIWVRDHNSNAGNNNNNHITLLFLLPLFYKNKNVHIIIIGYKGESQDFFSSSFCKLNWTHFPKSR